MDGTVFWKLPVQFEALLKITHIVDWLHIPVYFKILSLHSQVLKIHFSHKYADKNGRRVRIVTLPRFLYIQGVKKVSDPKQNYIGLMTEG